MRHRCHTAISQRSGKLRGGLTDQMRGINHPARGLCQIVKGGALAAAAGDEDDPVGVGIERRDGGGRVGGLGVVDVGDTAGHPHHFKAMWNTGK